MWQKAMDKKIVETIREQKRKEREKTKKKHVTISQNVADEVVQRLVEKWHRANFNKAWSTFAIKEACDRFH